MLAAPETLGTTRSTAIATFRRKNAVLKLQGGEA
jgi:hypothetical protein